MRTKLVLKMLTGDSMMKKLLHQVNHNITEPGLGAKKTKHALGASRVKSRRTKMEILLFQDCNTRSIQFDSICVDGILRVFWTVFLKVDSKFLVSNSLLNMVFNYLEERKSI